MSTKLPFIMSPHPLTKLTVKAERYVLPPLLEERGTEGVRKIKFYNNQHYKNGKTILS